MLLALRRVFRPNAHIRRVLSGLCAAFAATLSTSASSTNDILEAHSDIEQPTIEASLNYRTAKIEYGMVENDESVFGYEIEIDFYDAFTKDQRKAYDKFNGFIAVASCRLAVEF